MGTTNDRPGVRTERLALGITDIRPISVIWKGLRVLEHQRSTHDTTIVQYVSYWLNGVERETTRLLKKRNNRITLAQTTHCREEMESKWLFIITFDSLYRESSVPSEKILHWGNVCFSAHAIAQPCRRTKSEAFQALKDLCNIYTIWNLERCKCTRMTFHCANALVVVRNCAS